MQTVKENVTGFNGTVTGDVTFYPSSEVFTINNASSFLLTPTLNIVSGFSFDMVVSVNGMTITSYSLLEMNGVSISRTGNNIVIVINGTTTIVPLIEDWYICLSVRYQNGVTSVRYSNTPFPSASAEVARETFDLPAGKIKMLEGAAGASLNICRGSSPRYDAVGDSIVYKAVQTDDFIYKCWGRPSATIFESSTAGSYTVNLESGNYNVILVGGGGGGVSTSNSGGHGFAAGGGSGGYSLIENVFIEGGEYTVVVGAGGARALYGQDNTDHYAGDGGDSYITIQSGILSAGGGGGGHSRYNSNYGGVSTGGAGGSGNTISGNSGNRTGESYNTTTAGGASVYGGYGVGGNGCATNPGGSLAGNTKAGTGGYVKIFYLGE